MLYRRIIAQGARVASRTRSQLKNVKTRALSTAAPFTEASNSKKIALGVAGALVATGAYLYSRSDSVHAAESTIREKQREYFNKYASASAPNGERMMTPDDFLRAIIDAEPEEARKRGSLDEAKFRVLFNIADVDNTGLISFNEYVHFEDLINKPDAEYVLAFKIFDRDGNGRISKDDFSQVVATSFLSDSKIPFDFDCELVRLYFGKGASELDYSQFTQLLKDLQQERVKQEFRFYDKEQSGYIPVDKFAKILSAVKLRRIPDYVRQNLASVANLNKGTANEGSVSYAQFVAYMLLHIPSYGRVLRAACQRNKTNSVNKDEFLRETHHSTSIEITRLEVDIVWELFDTDKDGKLSLLDFNKVTAPPRPTSVLPTPQQLAANKTFTAALVESVENFMLGAVAGAIGATAVYPIDLVKTRMQNQRAVDPSKRVYANSWDCFLKVVRNEGALGLYKGLGPQIVGVAPEKAIKLTVNDLLRGFFEDKSKGEIYFPLEVLAGAGAGASQVLFTNPLEIVKIRLQVQGESIAKGAKGVGALTIVRELGFAGLYRGAGACLLRDIPFSAIYFPTYAKMKEFLKDENGKLTATDLLLAGAVAGIPAASLVTPADVIKTRLQVKARAGEQTYTGIRDCFWKVLTAEGPKAFFKGCVARVFRSSPQFGVTLLSYELLQQFFAPHVPPRPPTNVPVSEKDYADISGTVIKVEEMEKKFGSLTVDIEPPTNGGDNKEEEKPKNP